MKKYALISVYEKTNLEALCATLKRFKINIIATKSTGSFIKKNNYKFEQISELINFPEMLGGKVKTIHPKIHASLLFDRKNNKEVKEFRSLNFPKIDYVIVNLYPFEKLFANKNKYDDLVKMIDIGGVTLLRSAAKNNKYVTTITDINDYKSLEKNLISNKGKTTNYFRKKMASKAFETVSKYDNLISKSFVNTNKNSLNIINIFKNDLRYGENPHQDSFFYTLNRKNSLLECVIQGKQLSYNNVLDINSAIDCVREFNLPTCVIIKHNNPCGVASNKNLNLAYINAKKCDSISSFGGVLAFNKTLNEKLAINIVKNYYEVVIAPNFNNKILKILSKRKNLILIDSNKLNTDKKLEVRSVNSGYIFQTKNISKINIKNIKCATNKKSNNSRIKDLIFALKVCKHLKSNAIVLANNGRTLAIGAGQMSRVDSTKIAVNKIKNKKISFVAASDGFFPFVDSIKILLRKNCKAIVQPQGSINDKNIIKFANEKNLPIFFSKFRFFNH